MCRGRFEHVGESEDVRVHVGQGVFQRVAHARLGGEMNDPIGLLEHECCVEGLGVRNVNLVERKSVASSETGEAGSFQGDVVIVVEVVDTDDAIAPVE